VKDFCVGRIRESPHGFNYSYRCNSVVVMDSATGRTA
jgi:hypothetical protein